MYLTIVLSPNKLKFPCGNWGPNQISWSKPNAHLRFRTYKTGSPPPAGSKKVVLKFLSVNNMVIAPAKTGSDKSNKKAVIKIAQTNNGILWKAKLLDLILVIVQIKFIAPKIEAAPDKCKLKIAKSVAPPECAVIPDNGGYSLRLDIVSPRVRTQHTLFNVLSSQRKRL
jgi:hypothetical protein